MTDPFRPETNLQLMREARIGLTLLAITIGTFAYVAYHRISGSGTQLPQHVLNAPIAEAIWPGENPLLLADKSTTSPQYLGSQFGDLLANARKQFGINNENSPSKKLLNPSKQFVDPIPADANLRMPTVKVPDRKAPATLALADVKRDSANRIDNNSLANSRSKRLPIKLPLESNELRASKSVATRAESSKDSSIRGSGVIQKQIVKTPVIVTPKKQSLSESEPFQTAASVNDATNSASNFSGQAMRPLFEPGAIELATSADFEAPGRPGPPKVESSQPLRRLSSNPDGTDFAAAIQRLPDERAQNSSQVVTSDIAAELAEPAAIGKPPVMTKEQLTSFETETDSQDFSASQVTNDETNMLPAKTKIGLNVAAEDQHLVRAGESFWSIAQQHYDDGRFFRALYEYNKQRVGSFENLVPGNTLATPSKHELAKLWPELCPKSSQTTAIVATQTGQRVYVTQEGDTLFEIARQKLEQASRYLEIMKINQVRLPEGINHLSPLPAGIQLVLPLDFEQ